MAKGLLVESFPSVPELQEEIGSWGAWKFPNGTPEAVLSHLAEEFEELQEATDPDNIREEAADCFILLIQFAYQSGFDLYEEVRNKFETNKVRKWKTHTEEGGHTKHVPD